MSEEIKKEIKHSSSRLLTSVSPRYNHNPVIRTRQLTSNSNSMADKGRNLCPNEYINVCVLSFIAWDHYGSQWEKTSILVFILQLPSDILLFKQV